MTQDAVPQNEYFIENILKPFEDPAVAAVCGRQIARPDATPLEKFTRDFNYPPIDSVKAKGDIEKFGIKTFFLTNVCSAFRRSEFMDMGGFPEKTILNEDMIAASRLILKGKKIAYASKAIVIHSHDYIFRQQFTRYFDIGVSLAQNEEILKYTGAETEGNKFVKEAIKYLKQNKRYRWIVNLGFESIFKLMGYKLGLSYKKLPIWIVRSFSMHKFYWDK